LKNASDSIHKKGIGEYEIKSYVIGFILSILLTMAAYILVVEDLLSGWPLLLSISGLALLQTLVQVIFFLHLGSKVMPNWSITAFYFMVIIVIIVAVGSIWVMYHLDYRMMPIMDTETQMPVEKDKIQN
jgi:cytochrome o ubiquinol oxidase operon protein cyoD